MTGERTYLWSDGQWDVELIVEEPGPVAAHGKLSANTMPQENQDHEDIPCGKSHGPEDLTASTLQDLVSKANNRASEWCDAQVDLK